MLKIFGPKIKDYQSTLEALSDEEISMLQNGNSIKLDIAGEEYDITPNMVDIRISSKEGFNVGMENNNFIILNTELTDELIMEGIAREMVSKIQQLRKNKDFDIVDRITIYYHGDDEFNQALNCYKDYIKSETLALEMIEDNNLSEQFDLNGHNVYLDVKKVSN